MPESLSNFCYVRAPPPKIKYKKPPPPPPPPKREEKPAPQIQERPPQLPAIRPAPVEIPVS